MPNFFEIGSPFPEKILKGFKPYIDMAVILVILPGLSIYKMVPLPIMLHIKFDKFIDELEFYHEDRTIN